MSNLNVCSWVVQLLNKVETHIREIVNRQTYRVMRGEGDYAMVECPLCFSFYAISMRDDLEVLPTCHSSGG